MQGVACAAGRSPRRHDRAAARRPGGLRYRSPAAPIRAPPRWAAASAALYDPGGQPDRARGPLRRGVPIRAGRSRIPTTRLAVAAARWSGVIRSRRRACQQSRRPQAESLHPARPLRDAWREREPPCPCVDRSALASKSSKISRWRDRRQMQAVAPDRYSASTSARGPAAS